MVQPFKFDNNNFKQLQRNERYYLNGGDLHFLADNDLFRVHRYFFERESPFFRDKLTLPASPGRTHQGTSDSNAIVLDVPAVDFEKLLWVFYNPKYSLYETTVDDWTCILDLAHRWQFDEAKNLAVRELEKIYISPIDRICLYQKYQVDEILLVPLYAMLCAREEPLNIDESEKLGMKTVVGVYHARERLRAKPNDGGKSPLPTDLKQDEIHATIKTLFGIASPVSAGEAAAGTWIDSENSPSTSGTGSDSGSATAGSNGDQSPEEQRNSGARPTANSVKLNGGSPNVMLNGRFSWKNYQSTETARAA